MDRHRQRSRDTGDGGFRRMHRRRAIAASAVLVTVAAVVAAVSVNDNPVASAQTGSVPSGQYEIMNVQTRMCLYGDLSNYPGGPPPYGLYTSSCDINNAAETCGTSP